MNITLANHPAQLRHPVTKQPMFDEEGVPVPMFPEQKMIVLDGASIGYVGPPPQRNIMFIVPAASLTQPVIDKVTEYIRAELPSEGGKVHAVAKPKPPQDIDEDEEF